MNNIQTPEFDAVVDEYQQQHAQSIRLSGEDVDYFARYKIEAISKILDAEKSGIKTILDFGAGVGNSLPLFKQEFPQSKIIALDVSSKSLEKCDALNLSDVVTCAYDGKKIPIEDNSADLIFTACVFHHIEEDQHLSSLNEIRRVLRPGGNFFLFEHNPWNPLTLHAVKNCPFDENAVLINSIEMSRRFKRAGFNTIIKRYHLFIPGYFSVLRPLENFLEWCPLGAQYSLCGVKD